MIKINQIEELLGAKLRNISGDLSLTGVTQDSRAVKPGQVFVAVRGEKLDGNEFIHSAVSNGAFLVVTEDDQALQSYPGIVVPNAYKALSQLTSLFAGFPSEKLEVIGITGTNGKSTTNWLIYHALNRLGRMCMRIGTLGVEAGSLVNQEANLTTPDPVKLQKLLLLALEGGVKNVVMEVSSHSLAQKRVSDVKFKCGIFTNCTQDHLDYHKDMRSYFESKRDLFVMLEQNKADGAFAVVNIDDEYGRELLDFVKNSGVRPFSYGKSKDADFAIENFEQSIAGSKFQLNAMGTCYGIASSYIGDHNASNLVACLACLYGLGEDISRVVPVLSDLPQVPGRLEFVGNEHRAAYIDYAHTPDALRSVLMALRPLVTRKLWVVFGCGGDRDRTKRSLMGEIAAKYADNVVLTSDNPRNESPKAILEDILSSGIAAVLTEPDRAKAIEYALTNCERGDVVLVAGKGHENYQIVGGIKHSFSDADQVRKVLFELDHDVAV